MQVEIVPFEGHRVTLRAPDSQLLQQLRNAALDGGLATLTAGLRVAARTITVAVDLLVGGFYRVKVIVDNRQAEYEIASILMLYEIFQRARHLVDRTDWDADLKQRAHEDLNRVLERRRR